MGVFDKLVKDKEDNSSSRRVTTKGFSLGVPEAEAEATTASIKLDLLFEDYLDILGQLNNEKFIVLGRKGTGKSALGEHILSLSHNEPDLFCSFIKKEQIDIEKIIQIGKSEGYIIEKEMLYKWIILTQLITLFVENQSLVSMRGMLHLSKFINNNRGFVKINNYEVKEKIQQTGVSVNVEYFKRYLTAVGQYPNHQT